LAFVGWDDNGTILNSWDCDGKCGKNFTLTKDMVDRLKGGATPRKVLMSLGGQDGGTLECSSSQSFIDTLSKGLISLAASFGFDGFDFDIETRSGDLVDCSKVVAAVMHSLKASNPALLITMAPQMGDIYPDSADVSPGFNDQAPLVAMAIDAIDFIWVQMYNTWAQVETIAYAQTYGAALMKGYDVVANGVTYHVQIPGRKLALGFPACPAAAGSGFITPSAVATLPGYFSQQGTPIAGLMTWSIGWDNETGWQFGSEIARH